MADDDELPHTPRAYLVTPDGGDWSPFSLDDLKPLFPELENGAGYTAQDFVPITKRIFTNALNALHNRRDCLELYSRQVKNLEKPENYSLRKVAGYGTIYLHEGAPAHISTAEIPLGTDKLIEAIVIVSRSAKKTDRTAKDLGLPLDEKRTKLESMIP